MNKKTPADSTQMQLKLDLKDFRSNEINKKQSPNGKKDL